MSRSFSSCALVVVTLTVGCAAPRVSLHEPLAPPETRVPVVVIPGITGSRLSERETGRLVWGAGRHIFFPRDGGYAMARPLSSRGSSDSRLAPAGAIQRIRLAGIYTKPVYGPLLRELTRHGYRLGDLDRPQPDDSLFAFDYDWRQDNLETTALMRDQLDALRRVRGEETLTVDLIVQSNGAHLGRWLMKYGGATLAQAEAGAVAAGPVKVRKLIMVGSSNGGSLAILDLLERGRRYFPLAGRMMQPEVIFTFPAVYQDLPAYRPDLFVDEEGRALSVDLYDPETWRRHQWSVFAPDTRRRLLKRDRSDLFGDEASRLMFLREQLERARRIQRQLARDVQLPNGVRLYSIQNNQEPTSVLAALLPRGGQLKPFVAEHPAIKRRPTLRKRISGPGDGHAAEVSQLWLSPTEKAALTPSFQVEGTHAGLIAEPKAIAQILSCLAD